MMGRRQGQIFYSFDLDKVASRSFGPADRRFARSDLGAQGVSALLLAHWSAFD